MKLTVAGSELTADAIESGAIFLFEEKVFLKCHADTQTTGSEVGFGGIFGALFGEVKSPVYVVRLEDGKMYRVEKSLRVQQLRQLEPLALAA